MSAVLFQDNEHGDIGFTRVDGVDGSDDAGDGSVSEVCHDGEIWPSFEKIIIGEDWVWFCELCSEYLGDPFEFCLVGEGLESDFCGEGALHDIIINFYSDQYFQRSSGEAKRDCYPYYTTSIFDSSMFCMYNLTKLSKNACLSVYKPIQCLPLTSSMSALSFRTCMMK